MSFAEPVRYENIWPMFKNQGFWGRDGRALSSSSPCVPTESPAAALGGLEYFSHTLPPPSPEGFATLSGSPVLGVLGVLGEQGAGTESVQQSHRATPTAYWLPP